ncbi:hypothetical protein [Peribacillus simplex]|uniref:hypothetical protein n=1 Tax=Peribacillus simplex TaxID=1478 RepID=UPI0024C0F8D0|nr:hypothetical protein [Peribacillus simplex]WHZ00407.1 hypothetical protein QNH37_13470 [Peribacillus simplex]
MKVDEQEDLSRAIDEITEIAKSVGLDFYPMRYEFRTRIRNMFYCGLIYGIDVVHFHIKRIIH